MGRFSLVTVAVVLAVTPACSDASSQESTTTSRDAIQIPQQIKPVPPPIQEEASSKAREWAKRVKAELDVTTLQQFVVQMPEGMQPKREQKGQNRVFTYTFSDGSQIIATFRPRGGAGSGQGLVLYMVDIRDG